MSDNQKLLVISTHPIQYQVPWFRHLHQNLNDYEIDVLYLTLPDAEKQGAGFNIEFKWDIPLFEGYQWHKVETNYLAGDGAIDRFFSLRLRKTRELLIKFRPDMVLLTGWQCLALIQCLIACKGMGLPCLIRAESNNLKPRATYKRLIHRMLLAQYDRFLSIGRSNRNFYLTNGIKAEKIFPCPYFVDNHFFIEQASRFQDDLGAIKKRWDIPESAFCFCYVGKLSPKKRILDVLQAFKILANKQAHLLVVGDGELMEQAQRFVNTHQLEVSFCGFLNQSEVSQAYVISDCLVLASDYDETWGLVVNEAMACGLPAIVSDRCGCHPDLIKNNETGFSFNYGNCKDLAAKMRLMITDRRNTQLLGQFARENLLNHYSIEQATKGLTDALDSCI